MLAYIDRHAETIRPLPYTKVRNKPTKGVVLHHSAGSTAVLPRFGASWQWMVGKAALYKDVPENQGAHHVGNEDRWRPWWVEDSPYVISDVNWSAIGVEIVYAPQNGERPNNYQYRMLESLIADLVERYGDLPFVGHGDVDSGKMLTEPTYLDYARLGLTPLDKAAGGRFYRPIYEPPPEGIAMSDQELAAVFSQIWNRTGIPFIPDFAIPKQYLAAYRAGVYLGVPISPEIGATDDVNYQEFERGVVTYRKSDGYASWKG